MLPEAFRTAWTRNGDALRTFTEEELRGIDLPERTKAFLLGAGLPLDAAPFLTFDGPVPIASVATGWGLNDDFAQFYEIGFNGSGDPIVLASDGRALCLNHDCGFRAVYINNGVEVFAEALLRFRELIDDTLEAGVSYLDGEVSGAILFKFKAFLMEHDPRALESEAMWGAELRSIESP